MGTGPLPGRCVLPRRLPPKSAMSSVWRYRKAVFLPSLTLCSEREMTPYTRVRREALSVARSNEHGEDAQRRYRVTR